MLDFRKLVIEAVVFISPALQSVQSKENLSAYLKEFGYDIDPVLLTPLWQDIIDFSTEVTAPMSDLTASENATAVELAELTRRILSALARFIEHESILTIASGDSTLFSELFDRLSYEYIGTRSQFATAVLQALGVIEGEFIDLDHPEARQVEFVRIGFDWSRLGTFIRSNDEWASDVYGWAANPPQGDGKRFDFNSAITNLARLVEAAGLSLAYSRRIEHPETASFVKNSVDEEIIEGFLPIWQDEIASFTDDGEPVFAAEAGVRIAPYGDLLKPADLGLAIAPYAKGNSAGKQLLSDSLSLDVAIDAQAMGGAYVAITPNGVDIVQGGTSDAEFELGLRYAQSDSTPILLFGDPQATRIESAAIFGSIGGELTGDFYVAGGIQELTATIDLSEDGFLGSLVSGPMSIEAGSIVMGWRPGRGVYFDGGTSLSLAIPVDIDVGPIGIHELGVTLDWEASLSTTLLISADARVGPLYASVENTGVVLEVLESPSRDGLLGKYDLDFGFQPPSGYAIALDAKPIEGGGSLAAYDKEYRGALALKFENIGFSAFGVLATQLPDGRKGYSFGASIFAEFSVPLGFGFFLTGLGGVIGINRTIDTEAMRNLLYDGQLDNLLFPANPIEDARSILENMATVMPAREGQHLFGPVAKIAWGKPVIIDAKLGLMLEVGQEVRIVILGNLSSKLPDKDNALVVIDISFMGDIDFGARTLSFDSSIINSRVLTWPISGDAALRSGWGGRTDHVVSVGGLHPQYPRPASLPDLRRITINFGTNNPKITLSGYAAATLNSLQFGARADLYARGPKVWLVGRVAAEGWVYCDALIYFNPFQFDVALGGGLNILVNGKVKGGLGFDLRLTGPNTFRINGKVWITIFRVDVDFRIRHTWGSERSLPEVSVDATVVLRDALENGGGLEPVTPIDRTSGVGFSAADDVETAVDPVGGLRFIQRAVPLGVSIEKIGEAQVTGGSARVNLKLFSGSGEAGLAPAMLDFVRGHFFALSESERLRAPAFEKHKAGFEYSADTLVIDSTRAVRADYDYEYIEISNLDDRHRPTRVLHSGKLNATFANRWMNAFHKSHARPVEGFPADFAPSVPVQVIENEYLTSVQSDELAGVQAAVDDSAPDVLVSANVLGLTRTSASTEVGDATEISSTNPVVASYIAAAQMRI